MRRRRAAAGGGALAMQEGGRLLMWVVCAFLRQADGLTGRETERQIER